MKDTVFITGATGMLGRRLLPRLCTDDRVEKVIVLVRKNSPAFTHKKIAVLPGDVRHNELGLHPLHRQKIHSAATIIIHAAAETSFSSTLEIARRVNVNGVENLLR